MKIRNKLTALVLSMCILLTLMPSAALAAGVELTDAASGLKFRVLTGEDGALTDKVCVVPDTYTNTDYAIPETVTADGNTYTVTAIGNSAFSGCTSLTSVVIPDSVTDIGINAFYGTGLSAVIVPASVRIVNAHAFEKCAGLKSVTFLGITPPDFDAFIFTDSALEKVIVPLGTKASYGSALSGEGLPASVYTNAEATISAVTVTSQNTYVCRGSAQTFTAAVEGTGSFSPVVTWTVTGSSASSRIGQTDGVLTVAPGESAASLTVTATSLADPSVSGSLTVDVKPSAPAEQFTLPAGSICYFDLSGITVSAGTVNTALPDTSLKWVPFIYAGTVNAYSLGASADGDATASDTATANACNRSLFLADRNVYTNVSWNNLNNAQLIFGKTYSANGVSYLLRSLSVENSFGSPINNEWDQILSKGDYIHNYSGLYSWGQDTSSFSSDRRVLRGDGTFGIFYYTLPDKSQHSSGAYQYNFRPALEILNAGALSSDALKTVTYDMGLDGTLGSGSLTSATAVYTGQLTLPEIMEANGFYFTGAAQSGKTLGWYDGSTFYRAGTKLSLASGTVLTAGYGVSSDKTLQSVSQPAPISGIANGTAKTAAALGLPETVTLVTTGGNVGAGVTWDVASSVYNPSNTNSQTFMVNGTVALPAGVINPDGVALTTSVRVTVNAASSGGGSVTPVTPPSTEYNADVTGGTGGASAGTKVLVTVDLKTDTASLDLGALRGNLMSGGAPTVITVPSIPNVDTYTLGIPAALLSAQSGNGSLTLNTSSGSLTISSGMLANTPAAAGNKAEITIGQGDKSSLPDDVQASIGDRPLISLSLSIDGKQTEWKNPAAPVTVSVPYTPTAEELNHPGSIVVWYIDGSGSAVCIPSGHYDRVTGTVTFTTTHFSNYAVAFNKVAFNDVETGAWYDDSVIFIAARGIASGTGNGSFSPDAALTRGDFLVMLMRAYGIAPDNNPADNFADAGSTYYTNYLSAAKRLGISSGVGNSLFAPDREITRQEMFTLLYNALKAIGQLPKGDSGETLADYSDAGLIDSWAKDAIKLLTETGVIAGSGGKLTPAGNATRASMAQLLYNLLQMRA